MPNQAVISNIAAGGARSIVTSKPSVTHTAAGQYTITSYDINYNYAFALNSGTAGYSAPNGSGVFTITNVNAGYNLSSKTAIGITPSPSTLVERKSYTYNTPYWVQTGNYYTINGPCPVGFTCYGTCGPGSNNCGTTPGYVTCCTKDSTPAGYSDEYGEWSKIV